MLRDGTAQEDLVQTVLNIFNYLVMPAWWWVISSSSQLDCAAEHYFIQTRIFTAMKTTVRVLLMFSRGSYDVRTKTLSNSVLTSSKRKSKSWTGRLPITVVCSSYVELCIKCCCSLRTALTLRSTWSKVLVTSWWATSCSLILNGAKCLLFEMSSKDFSSALGL